MLQGEESRNGDMTLVALGSNAPSIVGDPRATVLAALAEIQRHIGPVKSSQLYQNPAFPAGAGPDFVNAACAVQTERGAADVLSILHRVEADFGRMRMQRWGQRTLDLDLIAQGGQIAPNAKVWQHWAQLPPDEQAQIAPDQLILPHPRLQDRSFVLVPLADVAPEWTHPVTGLTVTQMRDARPGDEIASVRAM
ncbi:2-amino-4-hydroxy-6-hydroxymethyldihydropteridine diphosphokinase [Pseudooctadecabacter sp.]|uniref:2-amino-4-hydroxy-6- hydroxymethyldihydropteridine diphosphokinase n=1 Tax=Pseudooctadecabacter sp. TaxID=1966338 RepID=UPI0035C78D5A